MTNSEKLVHILKLFSLRNMPIYGHFYRVSEMSKIIAQGMGIKDPHKLKIIKDATFFHDIGKIFVPDKILLKKSSLNFEEYEIAKKHVEMGIDIVSTFLQNPEITQIIGQHHEAYDGSGYPAGLSGDKICIGAKICHIADSFDVVYGGRCYCAASNFEQAIAKINDCSETQYDPDIIKVFNKCSDHINKQLYTYLDNY